MQSGMNKAYQFAVTTRYEDAFSVFIILFKLSVFEIGK